MILPIEPQQHQINQPPAIHSRRAIMRQKLILAIATSLSLAVHDTAGQILVSDDCNVTGSGTGFALGSGVNSGINPPTTRLTGPAASNLRYLQTATTKAATAYSITGNRIQVAAAANPGRFTLSANGTAPFDFASVLGTAGAVPGNPAVYLISVKMGNSAGGTQRCSFALGTTEGNTSTWDFGLQLYRATAGDNFYTVQKRIIASSSGLGAELNSPITTTAPGTFGTEIPVALRVTDAGAENAAFNSRVEVSLDGGSTWIYDTATDTDLVNGWRLDGTGRFIVWDQAGQAAASYDDFSVNLITAPPPPPTRVWTGAGGDDNWSTGANWGGTAPVSTEPLRFGLAARQANFNDIAVLTTPTLTFTNGGFTLDGNTLSVLTAVSNLVGNNTITLPLDWPTTSQKFWHVAVGSELRLGGFSAINTLGEIAISGGGTLRITGGLDINQNPPFLLNDGQLVLDGGIFTSIGGYRIGSSSAATAPVQTVISNGGSLTLEVPGANLRVGDANNVLSRLIIDNGSLTLFGGMLGIPYAAGGTGEVFQVGGLVKDCYVAFSDNGAGTGRYSITNGTLEVLQIREDTAGGSSHIQFHNAILRPALGANAANFFAGIDTAEILSGGLTLDATADVTIAQPLAGSGGLTKVNFATATLTGANNYSGNTVVQEGKLVLPTTQTNGGAIQVAASAELGVTRAVANSSLTANSLSFSASTLSINLGTLGNPVAPVIQVAALSASGGASSVTINVTGGLGLSMGQFVLVDYSGAIGGGFGSFVLGTLPNGVTATLVDNVANSSIDLNITAAPGLRWTGANGSSWDFGTVNWFDEGASANGVYSDGQPTWFLDGAATGLVDLTSTFTPASLTVSNATLPYVFGGPGTLNVATLVKNGASSLTRVDGGGDVIGEIELRAGTYISSNTFDASLTAALTDPSGATGAFAKSGNGTLTLAVNNNTFDGNITIQQGTLRTDLNSSLGSTNGGTAIASGATLDLNDSIFPHEPVTVSGGGVGGQGAIIDSSTATGVQHNLTDVTMLGDTTFGSPNGGRWDIRVRAGTGPGPGLRGNGFNLTKVGSGLVSISCQRVFGAATPYWELNLGDILVTQGTLAFAESMNLGNPGAALTVSPGAELQFFDMGLTNPVLRTISLSDAQLNCNGGTDGTNVLAGAMQLTGANTINLNLALTIINGNIGGSGGLTVVLSGSPATGTLWLNGANNFAGDTTVNSGTVGGTGSLTGNLIFNGGTFSPGTSLGTFTVQGNLTLAAGATTSLEIDRSQSPNSDRATVNGSISFGGTLTVALPAGAAAPQAGDVYQLFSQGGSGGFTTVNLPDLSALPGGLTWNTNDLLTLGRISVVGTAVSPNIDAAYVSGNNLILTGTGGVAGGTYAVVTATDVTTPVNLWTTNLTGTFSGGGGFSNAIPVNVSEPQRFFRLKQP